MVDDLQTFVAPVYVASLAAAERAALRADLAARVGARDEPFELTAVAWTVTAHAPAAA